MKEPWDEFAEFRPVPPPGFDGSVQQPQIQRNETRSPSFSLPNDSSLEHNDAAPEDPSPVDGNGSSVQITSNKVESSPQLPSNLSERKEVGNARQLFVGPDLPPTLSADPFLCETSRAQGSMQIGPALPPWVYPSTSSQEELFFDADLEASNISLPPDEPHFSATNGDQNNQKSDTNRFLPINSDDDDDIIGPKLPANAVQEQTDYMNRLIEFKTNKEHDSTNGVQREEWMVELPKKDQRLGLGSLAAKSSFSHKPGSSSAVTDQIRELWTAVPKDNETPKEDKASTSKDFEVVRQAERDKIQEEKALRHNRDRVESLLEIHQRKRKLGEQSDSNSTSSAGIRRPFDRQIDLQMRQGTNMGAEALNERFGPLDDKFGHGSAQKYL